ncbi:UDP-glucose 4-epimerase GalE [Ruicaihuangia caeni]|uniref:UDP-glucose 4-epimerase GalE n=1 Tax=Ruicaihuangia caeni TaxID=3042517 RepID=UPI00338F75CD
MRVLVTGGAGYIGAHVVRLLAQRGDTPIVVDDLSTGDRDRVGGAEFHELDLTASDAHQRLEALLRDARVDGVVHFAAKKQVGESVERPLWYFEQNVGGLVNLLRAVEAVGVERFVFSSSASVYGHAEDPLVSEASPTRPVNPYGQTKLVGEWLVGDVAAAGALRGASLRYFNVAGAGWADLGDTAVLNLVPMVIERIETGESPRIFGDDYPTADGTCVRDYVHVLDLAEAHLAVLDALADGPARHEVFNIGTGLGSSVRVIVEQVLREAGSTLEPEVLARRAGDPPALVADASRIEQRIGWRAQRGVAEIVASAWSAHRYR